ncbi:AraC family transcriptional regulator [Acinetobacter sp. S40]|uniref:AraC family transcriptional regulator n=1 Tax=unclassified Acinetobacter TaxID=196816 RepID=UPI00190BD757|nr:MULTISPECIES: AraC family transcriptional regulator [unclassified Acinetobacter]MBJ9986009.1 AraC family transcriptional regulator [Acinetobacter sp. S40]MBK0063926.1 AraC family transcriptional regulator [Acinetobacter sp. S55]MBK0067211.1 AraC family transcriptional regulator [Acinetobacter sp. S54]
MGPLSQEMDLSHRSCEADFAQSLMSNICGEHRLDTISRDTLNFHYDGMRLPHKKLAIGTISYGANVAINISHLKAYSISLPIHGQQTLTKAGVHYLSNEKSGLIVSNAEWQDLVIDKDCKKLQVVIPEKSLHVVLADLLKQPVDKPVIFNPEMHLDSEQLIGTWWSNIQNFLQLKSQYHHFYGLQMLSEDYENFIIKALLLSQENNYSAALKALSGQYIPAYLKKVEAFIVEHACEDLTIEDLYGFVGISKSKLHDEFQQFYGMSPMSYLRKYRLQQVYKVLNRAVEDQKISISKLAYDWGFTHLGRFSSAYREEFGESPSDTKRRKL